MALALDFFQVKGALGAKTSKAPIGENHGGAPALSALKALIVSIRHVSFTDTTSLSTGIKDWSVLLI